VPTDEMGILLGLGKTIQIQVQFVLVRINRHAGVRIKAWEVVQSNRNTKLGRKAYC
jgi:hypothetical protein